MPSKLNRDAYQKIVNEDIVWLQENTEDTLERHHILAILNNSERMYYDLEPLVKQQAEEIERLKAKIKTALDFCKNWKGDKFPIKARHFEVFEQALKEQK